MEFPYNYIVVAWVTTWIMVLIRVYFPAMKFLGQVAPDNAVYKYRYLNLLLFGAAAFLMLPFFLAPVFSNQYRLIFIKNYIQGILNEAH